MAPAVALACLMLVSSVVSVSGNVVLLVLLVVQKELRGDAVGLAVSSGLSDLALGLWILPFGVRNSLVGPDASPGVLCQGGGFLLVLLQTSSVQSLTWSAVHRFTQVCFALSYRRLWTAARLRWVLSALWAFSLLSAALPLLGVGSYAYSEPRYLCCLDFRPENRTFVSVWMALGVAVPIATVCSLYGYMVGVAWRQARRGTFMCNQHHCFYVPANRYLKSSVVMVTTSGCLLLCWTPHLSVSLYETFSDAHSRPLTSALSAWLVLTSSALTPWITCVTQTYRLALRRTIGPCLRACSCFQRPRPPSASLPLHSANQISTTTTAATATHPPSLTTPTPPIAL